MSTTISESQTRDGFFLFFGKEVWASQWAPSTFVIDNVKYTCAEQYMMAQKAKLFGDLDAYKAILSTSDPAEQKKLGRNVRGFNEETWKREAPEIVYTGNLAKFYQNPDMRAQLEATNDLVLVEAAPRDRVWGIGLGINHPDATKPERWRGTNWLGDALMRVRSAMRALHPKGTTGEKLPSEGDLRIWHTPNMPRKPFRADVPNVETAKKLLNAIADYDNFVKDDKPWTTVGGRRTKLDELSRGLERAEKSSLRRYASYVLEQCGHGGVPLVSANVQGLEVFEGGEWCEWHDPETDEDISDVMRAERSKNKGQDDSGEE